MWFKPEVLQVLVAVVSVGFYVYSHEWGKVLYWLGVIVLTCGLFLMKG